MEPECPRFTLVKTSSSQMVEIKSPIPTCKNDTKNTWIKNHKDYLNGLSHSLCEKKQLSFATVRDPLKRNRCNFAMNLGKKHLQKVHIIYILIYTCIQLYI